MATITSSFTGTDESPLSEGGLWASQGALGTMKRASNTAQVVADDVHSAARATTPSIGNNQYAQVVATWASDGGAIGAAVRMSGANAACYIGYGARDGAVWNSGFTLKVYDSGGNDTTVDESFAVTPTSGSTIRLEISGTSLTLKENGVTRVGPAADTTLASGQPGIGIRLNDTVTISDLQIDDFEGGDIVTGRTTKNTRAFPLGMAIGMHRGEPGVCS